MTKERHSAIVAYIAENQDNFVLDNGIKIYGVQILPFEVLHGHDKHKVILGFCVPDTYIFNYPVWDENGCKTDGSNGLFIKTEETSFVSFKAIDHFAKKLCEAGKLFFYNELYKDYHKVQFIQHVPTTCTYVGYTKMEHEGKSDVYDGFACHETKLFIKETVITNKPFNPPF